jgi:hypothetical protein
MDESGGKGLNTGDFAFRSCESGRLGITGGYDESVDEALCEEHRCGSAGDAIGGGRVHLITLGINDIIG